MLNCVIYIVIILFVFVILFFYITSIKRDNFESTTHETDELANSTKSELETLDQKVINKFIQDSIINTRLSNIEESLNNIISKLQDNEVEKQVIEVNQPKEKKQEIVRKRNITVKKEIENDEDEIVE
ncbi:hypothetical protein MseVgp165 [Melanoplus sanguinipes entomopoxvirus]|uniref:Uncharacterized protein n=1 Tax=Melanoplus sanguinipes entomopoxvirus TaxID=83191 RepID=Q9YVS7_MSEPV|nr:hypothetical protein MseVgp165 [Melanoplus sanguinipes entomopoxvirus]AAC97681.1 ORF MSV165 hypothetical protein [Melanoplus sanguinipes entomopoxvirus 'O']